MEMAMEAQENQTHHDLGLALERLGAAASLLEQAAERFAGIELEATQATAREALLEQRLAEAEAALATLRAESASAKPAAAARKTAPAGAPSLVSREGVAVNAGALDAALRSLSIEQRIAVKFEMLRAGLIG